MLLATLLALTMVFLDAVRLGISVDGFWDALLAAVVLGAATAIAWPLLAGIAIRTYALLFPVLAFLLTGLLIELGSRFLPGFEVDGVGNAILVAVALTAVYSIASAAISVGDDAAYERFAIRPLAQRYRNHTDDVTKTDVPGIIFLEIDGLAEPVLREAMQRGYAPTLARWWGSGSHRLAGWECDLSSQTSAGQAGILHGNNRDIPAFRWYDKSLGKVIVSNQFRDGASLIEQHASDGKGLLADSGASRVNLFSGDATDSLFTISKVGAKSEGYRRYFLFYATPYGLARMFSLFIWEIGAEICQGIWQRMRNIRPRMKRTGSYPLLRAFITVILRELSVYTIVGDMIRGVPAVYVTLAGYDDVAHHAGIRRRDALLTLRGIDRQLAILHRANRYAARPYSIVALSDHGQSQGATFRQKYGKTLEQVVSALIAEPGAVVGVTEADEGWGTVNSVLSDLLVKAPGHATWIQRIVGDTHVHDDLIELGPTEAEQTGSSGLPMAENAVVVLGSGNLGLISFTAWSHRLTYEEITSRFQHLIPGLIQHDGIGFVLVASAAHGAMAIGPHGVVYLDEDRIEGIDPLVTFGSNAGRHLLRHHGFRNIPDILVIGSYDPGKDEVNAFEEKVGCHGGLGGTQTRGFVMYPATFSPVTAPIVGTDELHAVLKRWMAESRATTEPGPLVEEIR